MRMLLTSTGDRLVTCGWHGVRVHRTLDGHLLNAAEWPDSVDELNRFMRHAKFVPGHGDRLIVTARECGDDRINLWDIDAGAFTTTIIVVSCLSTE